MALLPDNLVPAFQYIILLPHDGKPDYNLIKLWFACSPQEEVQVFKSKLQIRNDRAARDLLYDQSEFPGGRPNPKDKKKKDKKREEEKKGEEEKEEERPRVVVNDMNKSFEFDADCDELTPEDNPISVNFKKVDNNKVKYEIVRKLVFERQQKIERSQ